MVFMTERLVEMRRILKSTGSIYLHCDPTASHYIKVIMDGIFGYDNFKNEIVWQRTDSHNTANRYGRIHDIILFFTKNNKYYWNTVTVPYSEKMLKRYKKEKSGRMFTGTVLTAPRANSNSGKFVWRGTMPTAGRGWGYSLEQLEKWWSEGKILCKKDGTPRMDGLKTYLDEAKGSPVQSLWFDIPRIANSSKERMGYPTQKPIALLDRIIEASCPVDGIILDPFCGCGTTVVSAQKNNRNWIGIDICMLAVNSMEDRMKDLFPLLKRGVDYVLNGLPTTVEQAIALANNSDITKNEGRYQFQYWSIEKVGGFASTKKSGDGGVDGSIYFYKNYESKELDKMIISVKSDKDMKISYIRDLIGTLSNSKDAVMAGMVCIDEPTNGMRAEALKAGFYDFDFMGIKKTYQKVQILTIKDIIDGKKFDTPITIEKKIAQNNVSSKIKVPIFSNDTLL